MSKSVIFWLLKPSLIYVLFKIKIINVLTSISRSAMF